MCVMIWSDECEGENWCWIGRLGMAWLRKPNPTQCCKADGRRKQEELALQKTETIYIAHNDIHVWYVNTNDKNKTVIPFQKICSWRNVHLLSHKIYLMNTPEEIPVKQRYVICQLLCTKEFQIYIHTFCWSLLFCQTCLKH